MVSVPVSLGLSLGGIVTYRHRGNTISVSRIFNFMVLLAVTELGLLF